MKENSIEEDIKIIEYNMKCIRNVMNNFEDKLCENMQIKTDEVSKIIYNILSDYKRVLKENEQLRTEVNSLKEEKEQYKNDYFNLYEQNKQYIHYSKIEGLAEKIHNELDKNGITRAYQTIIDSYFDEVLGG